jgi:hypothetical protein
LKYFKSTFVEVSLDKNQIYFLLLSIIFYAFLLSNPIFFAGYIFWSESPTWILLIILFILLLSIKTSKASLYLFGCICGLMLMFRANQLIGIFVIMCFVLLANKIYQSLNFVRFLIPFLLSSSFALIHNLYYGKSVIFLQTSLPLPVNFPLKYNDLFYIFEDKNLQQIFLNQISGLLAISPDLTQNDYFILFLLTIRFSQFLYLLLIVIILLNKKRRNIESIILLLLPLGFLLPHIFLQIFVYNPRHIVIGYLSIFLIIFHLFYLNKKKNDLFV